MLRIWDNMVFDNKSLRWGESQGRHLDEIHRSYDTGLCNRIDHWEMGEILNKSHNYDYTIYLDEIHWPEATELITLPHTKLFSSNEIDDLIKRNTEFTKDSFEINNSYFNSLIVGNESLKDNHLYSNFDFSMISNVPESEIQSSVISNIKLTDSVLNEKIVNLVTDMVGIHIRRGRGIQYMDSIDSLPRQIQEGYSKYRLSEGVSTDKFFIYEFITDDVYFSVIDSILEANPNQKFYISHDLPSELFNYYLDRYPNKIYTKSYFLDFIKNRYKTPITHVNNIIDLFSLANTKFILTHPLSSWSRFAFRYNNTLKRSVNDNIEDIVDTYVSNFL